MTLNKKLQLAAAAGVGIVLAKIAILLLLRASQHLNGATGLQLYFGASVIALIAFTVHLWGYAQLGEKIGNHLLQKSARVAAWSSGLYTLFVVVGVVSMRGMLAMGTLTQAVVWLSYAILVPYGVAACVLAFSLIRSFKKVGLIGILSIPLFSFPILLFSQWLMILFAIPSTLFLFRQSKVHHDH